MYGVPSFARTEELSKPNTPATLSFSIIVTVTPVPTSTSAPPCGLRSFTTIVLFSSGTSSSSTVTAITAKKFKFHLTIKER